MKKLTILVDMDETIVSLLGAWVDWLNRSFGTSVCVDDITKWSVAEAFPSLTRDQVYSPLLCDEFWYHVLPIDGAQEALKQLIADGHKVLIVTSSMYQTLRTKMDISLFSYFPFLSWNDVIVTRHKHLIKGDVLVDDGIHNLENGDYLKILMDAPYNSSYDAEYNGMIRVKTWDEAYEVIQLYAEEILSEDDDESN